MSTDPTTPAPNGAPPAHPDHPNWAGPQRLALGAAVVGLGVFAVAGFANLSAADAAHADDAKKQFFLSYLAGWVYWLSLPVGGMALLMIHYLAKTSWGILLKRPIEAATRTIFLMAVLAVPIVLSAFMGKASPFWWSDPYHAGEHAKTEAAANDHKAHAAQTPDEERRAAQLRKSDEAIKKAVEHEIHEREKGNFGFLTPPVFAACTVVYFLFWFAYILLFNKWSRDIAADHAKVEPSLEKAGKVSGPGLILFAIVNTAAATHFVMSLEPSWASTMFPVIFTINSFLTTLCFCVALFLSLADRPPLSTILRPKFQIDMASLMLAFTLFWTYTSFSQMMLVWIGNLPEEIPFYLKRSMPTYGFWWWTSAALIVFHFALPFLLLLYRDVKLHPKRLRAVAVFLMVMCAVDVIWWIQPSLATDALPMAMAMNVGAVVGIGGVWGVVFLWQLRQRPILAQNETFWLPKGHEHHDHGHGHNGGHH